MICSNCGNTIKDESKFCQYCGTAVPAPQTAEAPAPADAAADVSAVYTPPAADGQPADAENAAPATYKVVEESQPQPPAYQPPAPPYYTGKPQASAPVPPAGAHQPAPPVPPLRRGAQAGQQPERLCHRIAGPVAHRRAVRLFLLPRLCRHALLYSRRDLRRGRDEKPRKQGARHLRPCDRHRRFCAEHCHWDYFHCGHRHSRRPVRGLLLQL